MAGVPCGIVFSISLKWLPCVNLACIELYGRSKTGESGAINDEQTSGPDTGSANAI